MHAGGALIWSLEAAQSSGVLAPLLRGMGALSRAVGSGMAPLAATASGTLTLGMSLVVIMVLGFVLTSQITDRVLEAKVRAATEQIERARNTVSGIVSGEEAARWTAACSWPATH